MVVEFLPKQQLLATIAARASTPSERLLQEKIGATDLADINLQARLHRLYTLVGADNDESQTIWRAQHHLDSIQIADMLSLPLYDQDMFLPSWIETLDRILTTCAADFLHGRSSGTPDRCLRADAPIPFEDLLLPFVCYARQQLLLSTQELPAVLSYEAHVSLEYWLLVELSQLATQALQIEFSRFRSQQEPPEEAGEASTMQRDLYEAFVEHYQGERLLWFLQKYSTLARLLVMRVEQWVGSCQEFLQRLARDYDTIELLFNEGQPIGKVTEVITGCSDNHHDGRSVFVLTFDSALKLVYKPRCMDIDRAFFNLLAWINTSSSMLPLQGLRVLSRASYGWMEYAAHIPCQTLQEVRRYYLRAGMLVCLCYMLGSADMHHENLVASGEHPMLIDLETILYSSVCDLSSREVLSDPLPEQHALIDFSVLNSGLLPGFYAGHTSQSMEVSALGLTADEWQSTFTWTNVNTNAMSIQQQSNKRPGKANAVIFLGDRVKLTGYSQELVAGFHAMYRFLLDQRKELLSQEGPLARFVGCPIRFVFRATGVYWKLLSRLNHPQFLQDSADSWIEMQIFQRPLLRANALPARWQAIQAELLSLERRDVPYFSTITDDRDLIPDVGEKIKDVFARSALDQIRLCIAAMSEEDMDRQVGLIRASILSVQLPEASEVEALPTREEEETLLAPEELLAMACEIADELERKALRRPDGSVSWIGFYYDEAISHYRVRPIEMGLYEGNVGIALFLVTLAQITGDSRYQRLAVAALHLLCQVLREAYTSVTTHKWGSQDVGGTNGLGSLVYALARSSQWAMEPDWLEGAWQAASLITEPRVSTDQYFDVYSGSAGAILGLLALQDVAANEQILERAIVCGRHLLKHRVETECGARSWRNGAQQRFLTGFSHGASGIAYALLRLYAVTGIQEFKEAAGEAINYEQHLFSPEARNWPDLRKLADPTGCGTVFSASLCHGATGIGLARLGGLRVLDTSAIRHDIGAALSTTLAWGLPSLDNLCCGNFGRLDLLVTASQGLQRPDLLERARQLASVLVRRARLYGHFHLLRDLPREAYNPGLFVGSAGVGYELLRLAYPESVPSLLLWQ